MCGYCSRMVGISQTCNHVDTALFRIEAAVIMLILHYFELKLLLE